MSGLDRWKVEKEWSLVDWTGWARVGKRCMGGMGKGMDATRPGGPNWKQAQNL